VGYQDGAGAGTAELAFAADGNSGQVTEAAGEASLLFFVDGRGPDVAHEITITDATYVISVTDASYTVSIEHA
jgi:hypothetical protein